MVKRKTPIILDKEDQENMSFGFGELADISYIKAENDSNFFISFIQHLKNFCRLSWKGIRTSQRHSFGAEPIDVKCLKVIYLHSKHNHNDRRRTKKDNTARRNKHGSV